MSCGLTPNIEWKDSVSLDGEMTLYFNGVPVRSVDVAGKRRDAIVKQCQHHTRLALQEYHLKQLGAQERYAARQVLSLDPVGTHP